MKPMLTRIINARVIDPSQQLDDITDISIEAGKIQHLGTLPQNKPDTLIDAEGLIAMPGLIDLGVRLREPGQQHKGSIKSETHAAICSGITSLCVPPDTCPIIDSSAVVELINQRSENCNYPNVYPLGALTKQLQGEALSSMGSLKNSGCVGVSNANFAIKNTLVLRRAMEYAATHDMTVFLHPEDHWLRDNGCAHEGTISSLLGIPGIPEAAETVAVARDLALIEHVGATAHFCRLSTNRAVEMIAQAQQRGLPVTCDVAAHQLHLTEQNIDNFDSMFHVNPPLRTLNDQQGLRYGLKNGTIQAICSDHQPHENEAKLAPFPSTEAGISALETLLPLALQLVTEESLDLTQMVECLTLQPAKILGINKGSLKPGLAADICIFDANEKWRLEKNTMLSRGYNTPFLNQILTGKVKYTLLNGEIRYQHHA